MATYYISVTGSTGNSGTSEGAAWPLSKVVSTSFVAGDNILFHKGDILSGTTNFTHSGSAGNPITFDLYGTAIDNAVLDGAGSSSPTLQISASYITINNLVIQNSTSGNAVLYLSSGVRDITIYNCYVNHGIRGIYAYQSGTGGVANIKVLNCYFSDYADNSTHTHGGGSAIQFNNVNGSGVEIAYNNCYTDMSLSDTARQGVGDIINLYQCNGTASSYMLVHDNNVRGGSSYAPGEAGLILGDVGGSYQYGYNNIFISPGAVGCQVQGGTFINMSNNKLYSPSYSYTFNGLSFGNYSGAACNDITMGGNIINWRNGNSGGGAIQNYYIDRNGNSTSTGVSGGAALADPTNWSTNTAYSTAGAVDDTSLPDPLWTGKPWNTITTGSTINPPNISYSPTAYTFVVGTSISSITPSNTGDAVTGWTISPSLSSGLNFSTSTGIITGSPTVSASTINYTITAFNSGGNDTTNISITVNPVIPATYIVFNGRFIRFK